MAEMICRPGTSSPRIVNVALRTAPYAGSVTDRAAESTRRPFGSRSETRTSRDTVAAERTSTRSCLTSGVRAGAYSTARSSVTDSSGTNANGRLTSPRSGSAYRYTTGTSSSTGYPGGVPTDSRTLTTAPRVAWFSDSTRLALANMSPWRGGLNQYGPSTGCSLCAHSNPRQVRALSGRMVAVLSFQSMTESCGARPPGIGRLRWQCTMYDGSACTAKRPRL